MGAVTEPPDWHAMAAEALRWLDGGVGHEPVDGARPAAAGRAEPVDGAAPAPAGRAGPGEGPAGGGDDAGPDLGPVVRECRAAGRSWAWIAGALGRSERELRERYDA
jgi:hypothetical protein